VSWWFRGGLVVEFDHCGCVYASGRFEFRAWGRGVPHAAAFNFRFISSILRNADLLVLKSWLSLFSSFVDC
jgi:hypothetical protein